MKDRQATNTDSTGSAQWWVVLSGIVLLAAIVRVCNLGTFSLWLDEAFTMTLATLPLPDLFAAALADPDNVPLYLIVTHVSLLTGLTEPWLRLVPIAAGLASIVVWALSARVHLGDRMSLLVAGFMALSTFHLRYSQELRAYPYLLLITGLAMLAADRLRNRPTATSAAALAGAVAIGWYTHFSFAMILVPAVGLVLFPGPESPAAGADRRRTASLLVASISLGTLAFVPWLAAVAGALPERLSRGATTWTLGTVGRRWEFLTVAVNESSGLTWRGVALAVLACAGLVVAWKTRFGRTVVIPSVTAIVVLELLFAVVDRWSKARYATAAWPFLVILIVLGLDAILRRVNRRALRVAVILAVGVLMLTRADAYHREGRPHWDRMARAIDQARRPAEPLLIESEWVATCLPLYYSGDLRSLRWSTEPIHDALERSPSVLLVTSVHHADNLELRRLAGRGALVAEVPETGRLYRLRPDMIGLSAETSVWPTPAGELVADHLEVPLRGCLARLIPRTSPSAGHPDDTVRLEFDEGSRSAVRYGLTGPRGGEDSSSFAWVTGPEAAVAIGRSEPSAARLSVTLRPFRKIPRQQLRAVVNGQPLGIADLQPGPQTVSFDAPESCWRTGRNLIVLQFRRVFDAGSGSRPRAAAIDRLEVTPIAQ